MNPGRNWRRLAKFIPVPIAVLSLIMIFVGLPRYLPAFLPEPKPVDFVAYYAAADILNNGQSSSLYDYATQNNIAQEVGMNDVGGGYLYPPVFGVLLRPLALLSFPHASIVWLLSNLCLLCVCAQLLLRIARIQASLPVTVGFTVVLGILPPVISTLAFGQVNIILATLVAGSVCLLDHSARHRRSEIIAGILLAGAIAIKVYPVFLLIPLLFRRRWLAIGSSALTSIVGLMVGIVGGGGLLNTVRYFGDVLPGIGAPTLPTNQSLFASMQRLLTSGSYHFSVSDANHFVDLQAKPLVDAPALVVPTTAFLSILVLTFTAVAIRRLLAKSKFVGNDIALVLAATLIVLPVVWDYYHVLLLLPWAVIRSSTSREYGADTLMLVAVFFLTLQRYWRVMATSGILFPFLSFGFLAVLAIWLLLIHQVRSCTDSKSPLARYDSPGDKWLAEEGKSSI